jgi:carbamoyl-phosphate synthase large subunit
MPQRRDLRRILVLGSGPIVIGQACEFDYSGTQAARTLKALGYQVVLVNSNPATIMTDPRLADATYIEPLLPSTVEAILRKERPDALLPTLGGQTALNLSLELHESGLLDRLGVEMLGASAAAIAKAEDRGLFRACCERVHVEVPRSHYLRGMEDLEEARRQIGTPCVLRPAFTLGGGGSAFVERAEELERKAAAALHDSPVGEVLMEESLLGWKEFELEVMRDGRDNVVIVCSIENLDPMGVHTGDSITVAPQQTLTDREYQAMRRAAIDIIREVGVVAGGCNIQFAVHPNDGRLVAIEANPRVSRSSALASKATGFPIAKIAAQLAVGLSLDEIRNDITGCTPASYEPALDYVVVKIPRFAFEKFPGSSSRLGTSMKSVGEAMALGRTFPEAMQKGLRSLEKRYEGLDGSHRDAWDALDAAARPEALRVPTPERLFYLKYALADGWSVQEAAGLSAVDPWFVDQIERLVEFERDPKSLSVSKAKQLGYSDAELGRLLGRPVEREAAAFLAVDTCAGEFPAQTPYFYSTFDTAKEQAEPLSGSSVLILGSGPNRIGQGIEFDCMCVQASQSLRRRGFQSILVNSNPETVSTDYDVSSRLYFEPLTLEHVLEILEREKPGGVVLQLGGQTPLKLAHALGQRDVPILGTSPDAIDVAESRERFASMARELGLTIAPGGMAATLAQAREVARKLGYPVLVRPSYVLSGSAMRVVLDEAALEQDFPWAKAAGEGRDVLLDKFIEDALEIDVDALCDGEDLRLCGVMEHIEEAGIHSGDSTCFLPPRGVRPELIAQIEEDLRLIVRKLGVVGFLNAQYGLRGNRLYLLEVNPRASRTVPYLCKAFGMDFVDLGVELMLGKKLADLPGWSLEVPYTAVKEVVLPFKRLEGMDPILGPEMKSTGEVMGIDRERGAAFAKALMASGHRLPQEGGTAFLSLRDVDKRAAVPLARRLARLGMRLVATEGTARALRISGLDVEVVRKVQEGRPNIVDLIEAGKIELAINTPAGREVKLAGAEIRQAAVAQDVPLFTTLEGAHIAVEACERLAKGPLEVTSLQEWHASRASEKR